MSARCVIPALASALLCACTSPPPPPLDEKPATLKAWAEQYVPKDEAWRLATLSEVSALYLDTRIGKAHYPLIRYRMKYENFEPNEADGHPFRSTAVVYEADCSRMLHRIARVTAFERLGLAGARFEAANPVPDWNLPEMGSDGYQLTALACTLAQPAIYDLDDPRMIRFDPQAVSTREIAATVWVRQNRLAEGGWSMIGSAAQTAEFISDANFDFDAYPLVRYDAKIEFFHPVAIGANIIRSESRRIEVDCAQHRQRDLFVAYHEGQNLTGARTVAPDPGDWSRATPKEPMPLSETMACLFAYDLKFDRGLTTTSAAGKDLF